MPLIIYIYGTNPEILDPDFNHTMNLAFGRTIEATGISFFTSKQIDPAYKQFPQPFLLRLRPNGNHHFSLVSMIEEKSAAGAFQRGAPGNCREWRLEESINAPSLPVYLPSFNRQVKRGQHCPLTLFKFGKPSGPFGLNIRHAIYLGGVKPHTTTPRNSLQSLYGGVPLTFCSVCS
jgi:hypothetical protein